MRATMSKRSLGILFILLLVAAVYSADSYTSASVLAAECLFCAPCSLEGEDGHITFPPGQGADNDYGVGVHPCFTGLEFGCEFHHPSGCSGSDMQVLLTVMDAARRGDGEQLKKLVAEQESVTYVTDRAAVQVASSCTAEILGHFPLR